MADLRKADFIVTGRTRDWLLARGMNLEKQKGGEILAVEIIPIGGLGEVGKNMTALGFDGNYIIVDMGIRLDSIMAFEDAEIGKMSREELININGIPDDNILHGRKVKAIVLTHVESARDLHQFPDSAPPSFDVSPAFRVRCRDAALAPLALARLREERSRVGFVPLSMADYIEGIAKARGVSLTALLDSHGIAALGPPDAHSAPAFAGLARNLGMSFREALAHIRIGLAEAFEAPPAAILMARARSAPGRRLFPLDQCEAALEHIEASYTPAQSAELRRVESALRAAYAAPPDTSPR